MPLDGRLAGASECCLLPLALLGVEAMHPLEGTSTNCLELLFFLPFLADIMNTASVVA